jgi:ribosomal protein S14
MATPIDIDRWQTSNTFARERDAHILWLLERHPATAGMLAGIGLFGSRSRAAKRLKRLVAKKKLRLAGTVSLQDNGRPEHVYCRCRWATKADTLLHEVQISRVCFRTHADQIRRGPGETDPVLRPDAELIIGGRRYLLEFDRGTMSYQQVAATRFEKYRSCRDLVLWVCSTQARMEGLRARAEMIRETALFTTLGSALRDPHAENWTDFDGGMAALPRGGNGSRNGWPKR